VVEGIEGAREAKLVARRERPGAAPEAEGRVAGGRPVARLGLGARQVAEPLGGLGRIRELDRPAKRRRGLARVAGLALDLGQQALGRDVAIVLADELAERVAGVLDALLVHREARRGELRLGVGRALPLGGAAG